MASPARDVIGTWDDVFGASPAEVQALAAALAELIRHVHPGVVAVARPGDGAVTFGHGPRKMKYGYAYLAPHRDRVNLGFYQGARLTDPAGLLEGTGKALRHVKVRALPMAGLEALILQARQPD
jgi:Domain of unknown function (DU1801)